MDKTEKPMQAAKRELFEETGLKASTWKELGYTNPLTMIVKLTHYLYLARNVETKQNLAEAGIEVMKIPFETTYNWVMENKITHSPSCVAILKAKIILNNQLI